MKSIQFNCYDVIECQGHTQRRLYLIQGIHIGATDQDSAIELMPIDRTTPTVHGDRTNFLVPIEMLEAGIEVGLFEISGSSSSL